MNTSIVYFGTPEFSADILERLINSGKFIIKAVVTSPDKPVGRKQVLTPSPVSQLAQKHGIPILKPAKLDINFLTINHQPLTSNLFIVASFGKIIPQTLLDIPKLGAINVHPSLLPKYRGPSPILTPILNGDKQTGVTIMLMDAQMDHGPILAQIKVAVSENETHESLTNKLAPISSKLLIETLEKFVAGKLKPKPQNHEKATFTKLIKKEDGYFDIENPPNPNVLDRMIRAYYPWPNAWTRWNDKIVKFLPVIPAKAGIYTNKKWIPDQVRDDNSVLFQMEGKKPVILKDFLNGHPNFPLKNLFRQV